jgi:hypothetical protein
VTAPDSQDELRELAKAVAVAGTENACHAHYVDGETGGVITPTGRVMCPSCADWYGSEVAIRL